MATNDTLGSPKAVAEQRIKETLSGAKPVSRSYWLRHLLANRVALVSSAFILMILALALFVPLLSPYDPSFVDPINRLLGPSPQHWLGTDDLGRDVLTRTLYGTRVSLLVGASVTLSATILGTILGLLAGYYNRLDSVIMRVMDGFMAFPSILLAIAVMAALGAKTVNVIIALAIVYTPRIARLVRGTTLMTKEQPYVESARAIGASDWRILPLYILVNSLSPLIIQSTFIVAYAIIAEASLSFLGVGVPPDVPTWGNMLRDGQRLLNRAWWLAVLPGVALFLTVLCLNLIGDGLRDALDPRARER